MWDMVEELSLLFCSEQVVGGGVLELFIYVSRAVLKSEFFRFEMLRVENFIFIIDSDALKLIHF